MEFRLGACPPGTVGDGTENIESGGSSLHCFADVVFEGEAAVKVDPEVSCGGGRGVLGDVPLDCEGDVVSHGFWGRVEDADAGFVGREGEFPQSKPGRDVVKDRLDVPEFGLASSGGATGD